MAKDNTKMKIQYKYIYFVDLSSLYPKRKTSVWRCDSRNGDSLGYIAWFSRWRQYCFYPRKGTVYSTGCMNDIIDFIKQLKEKE